MALVENRKAYFNYEILETLEAGLELKGFEVKAIVSGKMSLAGARVKIYNNEAWLVSASIAPYQQNNVPEEYDQERPRRLLLHKDQIAHLLGVSQEKGLTIVPIKLYNKNNKIKIEIAIGRGKKKQDKRESIKKREAKREMRR